MNPDQARLRQLPQVDRLMAAPALAQVPHLRRRTLIRQVLDQVRQQLLAHPQQAVPGFTDLIGSTLQEWRAEEDDHLQNVINATGVLLHTNLGRAPLAPAVAQALAKHTGYVNLEFSLADGKRGTRNAYLNTLLCTLSGAQAALVVNNNAAAVLLALSALAHARAVVVSRGELVEIGGAFRIPDIIVQGGAQLCEVGTTNRTRLADYAAAIRPDTAVILKVHPSNFVIQGFTETVPLADLVTLAAAQRRPAHDRLWVIEDLGAATFAPDWGAALNPRTALEAGADLVLFSGDKVLGGPQAGIILGNADAVAACARHPLFRALRPCKLTLAALEATLRLQQDGHFEAFPWLSAARTPPEALRQRARAICDRLEQSTAVPCCEEVATESTVGGGSLPGQQLPSWAVALRHPTLSAHLLAGRLRRHRPPVIAKVHNQRLLLDLRSVPADQDEALFAALLAVCRDSLEMTCG